MQLDLTFKASTQASVSSQSFHFYEPENSLSLKQSNNMCHAEIHMKPFILGAEPHQTHARINISSNTAISQCNDYTEAVSVCKWHTFYISFQVGSIHNDLRRRLHLQVSPQPCGLLQRRPRNCSNGLHHFMGHILNTQIILIQTDILPDILC